MKKIPLMVSGIILAMLVSGCLNCEQETSLNADLSGVIVIDVFTNSQAIKAGLAQAAAESEKRYKEQSDLSGLISSAVAKRVADKITDLKVDTTVPEEDFLRDFNLKAIKHKRYEKFKKDGVSHCRFSAEFSNIKELYKDSQRINIAEDRQGNIIYVERISAVKAIEVLTSEQGAATFPKTVTEGKKSSEQFLKDFMNSDFFKGCYVKYTLHMPREIIHANTKEIHNNTASWTLRLQDVTQKQGFSINVTMKPQNTMRRWYNRILRKKAI